MVLVLTHDDCLSHVTPPGHPEQVARLEAVERGLRGLALDRRDAAMGDVADVLRCHPQRYLDRVHAAVPAQGWAQVDGDTFLSPGSFDAAMRGVGGICQAVDHVMTTGGRAFVAARPPGHHAERETAMGFCLFGTVAIGTMRALKVHGLSRVAVLDFDVHHGNGTQDLLWDEARVRFVSSHQMPLYPGSGHRHERGAHGQITNLPLAGGSGGAQMWAAWAPVLDDLRHWQPQLILLSAGFDAHRDDPLAGLNWTTPDFARLTRAICDLANECCDGRVVSSLEGGYDLDALAESVAAHVTELGRQGA
ncbi:MAG: histone deacetylase family protein [Paracoccaceae bacterium]